MKYPETASSEYMSEKDFSRRMFCSLSVIISALICLTFSARAFFGDSVSVSQTVSSANFYVEAAAEKNGEAYQPSDGKIFEAGTYKITLTAKGSAEKRSGFCKIIIGNDLIKYTPQMCTQEQKEKNVFYSEYPVSLSFELTLAEDTTVEFFSSWSTYTDEISGLSLKSENGVYEKISYTKPAEPEVQAVAPEQTTQPPKLQLKKNINKGI